MKVIREVWSATHLGKPQAGSAPGTQGDGARGTDSAHNREKATCTREGQGQPPSRSPSASPAPQPHAPLRH